MEVAVAELRARKLWSGDGAGAVSARGAKEARHRWGASRHPHPRRSGFARAIAPSNSISLIDSHSTGTGEMYRRSSTASQHSQFARRISISGSHRYPSTTRYTCQVRPRSSVTDLVGVREVGSALDTSQDRSTEGIGSRGAK